MLYNVLCIYLQVVSRSCGTSLASIPNGLDSSLRKPVKLLLDVCKLTRSIPNYGLQ